jgi:two-component system KDP operon response regulator KdpE
LFGAGFEVLDVDCPDEAAALGRVMAFNILLLKVDSDDTAARTCRALRQDAPQGVLVALTEREDPRQTIEILEAGADCCFAKSIYLPELIAHLRAAVRLGAKAVIHPVDTITIGDVRLEAARRLVTRGDVPVNLSPTEFKLLHHMMAHAGVPLTHASLKNAVWGTEQGRRTEHLRRLVRELRVKLRDDDNPRYLLTDSRIGYRFVEAEKVPPSNGHTSRAA